MVFKLLRIDVPDARKIPLDVGKHLIGRGSGKFLQCDDKRVSRQHGELEVTDNSVTLKALHTNPCFYLRKGTSDRETLKQNESVSLGNGDKFGLLPADCWYEILYLPYSDTDKDKQERTGQIQSNRTAMLDSTEVNTEAVVDRSIGVWYPSLASGPPLENVNDEPHLEDRPLSPNASDQSQSLLQNGDLPSTTVSDPSPLLQSEQPQTSNQESSSLEHQPMKFKIEPVDRDSLQSNLVKRPLLSTSDVKTEPSEDVKRIKMEPDPSVPGSSNEQNGVNHNFRSELRLGSTDSTKTCLTYEMINKINSHLSDIAPSDRWDHAARSWAGVMRSLPKDQQIFAEKLINDVLFEAQLSSLCRESRVDARLPASTIDLTDF